MYTIYSRSHTNAMTDILMRLHVPRDAKMANRTNLATPHYVSKMAADKWLGPVYGHAQIRRGHRACTAEAKLR